VQSAAHGAGVVISRTKKPPQLLVAADSLTWSRVDGAEEVRKLSLLPLTLFDAVVVRNVVRQSKGDNKLIAGYLLGPAYLHNELSIYSTYAPGDTTLTLNPPEAPTPTAGRITRGAAGAAYQPMHGDSDLPKLTLGTAFNVKCAGAALDVVDVEVPPGAAVFLGIMIGARKTQVDKYILYAALDDAGKTQRAVCFWSAYSAAAADDAAPTVDAAALARTAFDSALLKSQTPEAQQKVMDRAASRWAVRAVEEAAAQTTNDTDLMEMETYTIEYRSSSWPDGYAEKKIENHAKGPAGAVRMEAMAKVARETCIISKAKQRSLDAAENASSETRIAMFMQALRSIAHANKRAAKKTEEKAEEETGAHEGQDAVKSSEESEAESERIASKKANGAKGDGRRPPKVIDLSPNPLHPALTLSDWGHTARLKCAPRRLDAERAGKGSVWSRSSGGNGGGVPPCKGAACNAGRDDEDARECEAAAGGNRGGDAPRRRGCACGCVLCQALDFERGQRRHARAQEGGDGKAPPASQRW
jgi:hypothetical protein